MKIAYFSIDKLLTFLVVVACVLAVTLFLFLPADSLDTEVIYRGF